MEMQIKSPVPIFSLQPGSIKSLGKTGEAGVRWRLRLKLELVLRVQDAGLPRCWRQGKCEAAELPHRPPST